MSEDTALAIFVIADLIISGFLAYWITYWTSSVRVEWDGRLVRRFNVGCFSFIMAVLIGVIGWLLSKILPV